MCNIDLLWSKFSVTIFYSLSLMLFKGWQCLASSFNVQCLFYPAFLLLASPPPYVLRHCLYRYYAVVFNGRCAQGLQIHNHRKLTYPHFQEKCDPFQSILASIYNFKMFRQNGVSDNNAMLTDKTHPWEAVLSFWYEDIAFLWHTKWSNKRDLEVTK